MEFSPNISSSPSMGRGAGSGSPRGPAGNPSRGGGFRNNRPRRPFRGTPPKPASQDPRDIIAKAVKQVSIKEGLRREEAPKPQARPPYQGQKPGQRPRGPGDSGPSGGGKRSGGKRSGRGERGGAFGHTARMHTYKHKPYLQTGKDVDVLATGSDRLRIAVLGGNEEVGRNCTMLEYGNDIIIIDMGLQFPDEDMPGVDYIVPNISCLKGKEKNIRGVIITHAHLDHIGGIPHLIPRLGNPPIFTTDLTAAIIKKRQEDHRDVPPLNLHSVKYNDKLQLGSFVIEFFGVAHSVPTSMGIIVGTPCGTVVHTGDFKLENQPGGQSLQETEKIKDLANRNVIALMIDSTNATKPGRQMAEVTIQHNIDEIMANAKGRVVIGTFSSMISRIQQIILACERQGRVVAVEGFSMKSNIAIAQELGYMKIQKGTLVDTRDAMKMPREKVAIVCTGAQGEERAVLMRIANREHPFIEIEPGDTVVFSSSVIPGNERSVQRVKDTLYREGATVVHYQMMDVHAGGHAQQDDLVEMHQMIKPKYLIPIEGHYSFLVEHANAAARAGFKRENIFIADNGQIVEFDKQGNGQLTNHKVDSSYVFVDGLGVGDTNHIILRDRQELADDGIVVVIAVIQGKTGRLMNLPDIISRGFVYMKEHQELIMLARKKVAAVLKDNDPRSSANGQYLKDRMRDELGDYLFHKTKQRPMILPILVEV